MTPDLKEKISRSIKQSPLKKADEVLFFIPVSTEDLSREGQGDLRHYIKKKTPRLYEWIGIFVNSFFEQGAGIEDALAEAFPSGYSDKIIINIGSGTKKVADTAINLDCYPYAGVNIVADVMDLPFVDRSVDIVIAVSLLEHVPEPETALAEIKRVLKPGGYFYCSVPFMYPFHSAPRDYSRFTHSWFRHRLENFVIVRSGIDAGPVTALSTLR